MKVEGRKAGGDISPISIALGTCAILLAVGLLTTSSFSQAPTNRLPTSPPREYSAIIPCHSQLGQLWAPPSAFQLPGGNELPMLGFYQGQLVAMVFYLSEKHLYSFLPGGGRWGFQGDVNATVASITIAPAQFRPNRDRRAYEITVMIQHDPPVAVTCGSGGVQAESGGGPAESGVGERDGGVQEGGTGVEEGRPRGGREKGRDEEIKRNR